jgi:hypothetical protein
MKGDGEGAAHRLARLRDLHRIVRRTGAAGGPRLDPGGFRQRARRVGSRLRCGTEAHGPRTALPSFKHVEAHVRGDAVQPRPQRPAALEPVEAAQRADERLLNRVLGIERAEQPMAEGRELHSMLLELIHDRDHRPTPVSQASRG